MDRIVDLNRSRQLTICDDKPGLPRPGDTLYSPNGVMLGTLTAVCYERDSPPMLTFALPCSGAILDDPADSP